ncbi:MAG TPA: DUF4157 domain-containing protein, partial [Kofleriaceae bacterium]|nr:DUF4157 domain-containing protein [Kofleriaceae bacterium]
AARMPPAQRGAGQGSFMPPLDQLRGAIDDGPAAGDPEDPDPVDQARRSEREEGAGSRDGGDPAGAGAEAAAPTVEDVATAAVETRSAGRPVDPSVRERVESHLGSDFSNVRVHDDDDARVATAAMGARAFAYGSDVFLGPGESDRDQGLMAHELTHVAQQSGGEARPAAKIEVGQANSPQETEADAVAAQVTSGAAPEILIAEDDARALAPGQMRRGDFLSALHGQATAAAGQELGPLWSAEGCPFLEQYFAEYRGRPGRDAEQTLRRFTRSNATTAQALLTAASERIRQGIRHWRDTGEMPADIAAASPAAAKAAGEAGATPAPPGTAAAKVSSFGPGRQLEAATAQRMGDAFDASFAGVTVHTGPEAARAVAAEGATAMAVGEHVAFAAGAYQPGTLEGDAVLAHELAHTMQQRGGGDALAQLAPLAGESAAHESDADQATGSAIARLWGKLKGGARAMASRARVELTSGLQLQRCKGGTTPHYDPRVERKGAHEGQRAAVLAEGGNMVTNEHVYKVGATVGEATSESEALTVAKVTGGSSVVVAEEGVFFVYKLDGADILNPVIIANAGFRVDDAVTAVVVGANVYRPGGVHEGLYSTADTRSPAGDPFAPYLALHAEEGGLASLKEAELIAVFQAALTDSALTILAASERQAATKQAQFSAGPSAISPGEQKTIDDTAREALPIQKRIDQIENQIAVLEGSIQDMTMEEQGRVMNLQEEKQPLVQKRREIDFKYPMLGRYKTASDLAEFIAKDPAERAAALAGDAGTVLQNIAETRGNVLTGDINLWGVPGVVDATIAGLGIQKDTDQRRWIEEKAAAQQRKELVSNLVLGAFSIGLGLAAAFTTGGLSLALTAGAVGLGAYDAVTTTEEYGVKKAGTDTDIDKTGDTSLLPEDMRMHWGWLVLAWAGLGLDIFDAVKVADEVGKIGRGLKTVDEAAQALANGDAAVLARLRKAAGNLDIGDAISEANRSEVSRLVGTTVEIDPRAGASVKVHYDVDAKGRTVVTGIKAGTKATTGDILAHASTVRMLERRSGLVERVQDLWTRIRTFGKKGATIADNPFPVNSAAYESWIEIHKLKELAAVKRAQLDEVMAAGDALGAEKELRRQIAFLENDLDIHGRVVDTLAGTKGGRGFVAMSDDTRAALEQGKRLPDFPDKGIDDLGDADLQSSAYYYVRKEDGSFDLATKPDRVVDPAAARATPTPVALTPDEIAARGERVVGAVPAAKGLDPDALVALAHLDDAVLKRLARAPKADLERLAAMLGADPTLADRLARVPDAWGALRKAAGTDPAALDEVMFAQRLSRSKVGGSSERIGSAVRRSKLPWADIDRMTDADLAHLGKGDEILARARQGSRPGKADPELVKQAQAELDQIGDAAARDRLRAEIAHGHGLSDLPFTLDPAAALRARFPGVPTSAMDELVRRHPDALRALESASEDDVRRIIHLLGRGSEADAKDVEDILRSYMYGSQKRARKAKGPLEPPENVAGRAEESVSNLGEARARGYPFGFKDKAQYEAFVDNMKKGLDRRGIKGEPRVQGSAMHSKTPRDIDVEIQVDQAEFDRLAERFSKNATGRGGRELETHIKNGKIPSSHFFPDHFPSVAAEAQGVVEGMSVQATLIVKGSDFDVGPFL